MEHLPASADVTRLLHAASDGDRMAAEELLPLVYAELRSLAVARMRRLPAGQTIQPTALVHEAYLKLVRPEDPGWDGRGHFFGAAARAMQDLLVDAARRKARYKHGGGVQRVAIDDDLLLDGRLESPADDIVELDRALERMAREHPRSTEIVRLRYFTGLTNEQVADVMGLSERTVGRGWRFGRAWLHQELGAALDGAALDDPAPDDPAAPDGPADG